MILSLHAGDTAASSVTICIRDNDQSRNCIILTQFPSQLLMMQRSGLCGVWNITIRLLGLLSTAASTPGSSASDLASGELGTLSHFVSAQKVSLK